MSAHRASAWVQPIGTRLWRRNNANGAPAAVVFETIGRKWMWMAEVPLGGAQFWDRSQDTEVEAKGSADAKLRELGWELEP